MWKSSVIVMAAAAALSAQSAKYGVGRAATAEQIRKLGAAIGPDGEGLPAGSGAAAAGKEIFAARCAGCHGEKGEGGTAAPLAGGQGTLASPKPLKTVGSYWPYATTVWDYVNRAMPFDKPGLLSAQEVYAVTAYVLYLNNIVELNQVMDAKSLPKVRMPNRDGFIADPRPDVSPRSH
ncbi:MAG TPA: cytochrome c [Bryobacteraceae bacterium]|nr:cytochrome c [Bryobacteraceae bacterium]